MEYDRVKYDPAWSRVFLVLAQSEKVLHFQREHGVGSLCLLYFFYTGPSLRFPQTSHIYGYFCHLSAS